MSQTRPDHRTPLTPRDENLEAFAAELDDILRRASQALGEPDIRYLRSVVRAQRALETCGRCLLQFGRSRPTAVAAALALATAKTLDNLEIGHNVLHGQYDWAKDPHLNSRTFEWDVAVPARLWRYQHNFVHHTYTNVYGRDENLSAGPLRVSAPQPWHRHHLLGPLLLLVMAPLSEWFLAAQAAAESCHDSAPHDLAATRKDVLRQTAAKAARQAAKDLVVFPLLSGRRARRTLLANAAALLLRNVWIFTVALISHYPQDLTVYDADVLDNETRGQWYARQVKATANIRGGRLLHLLSGHHTQHIEHHLFPGLPASRYQEVAPRVREVCERHGIPYATASLPAQLASALRHLVALSLPPGPTDQGARTP